MKKDIFLNAIFTFLISIFLFIQNRYFVIYMNIETLGIMKLFTQLLQYLDIAEMGLGGAAVVALYKPLIEKDKDKLSVILNTIKHLYTKIGIIILTAGLIITPILPFFIKLNDFSWKIYCYWILYVINTIVAYLFVKYVVLFTANQEYIYIRAVQCCSKIICQILQIVTIYYYHSFFIFILILILENIFQYIIFKRHYKKNFNYIYKTKEKYSKIITDMKNLFWHRIAGLIVFNTDLILISKFTSIKTVGIYASYQLIVQLLNKIIEIIFGVLRPKIGKLVASSTQEKIYFSFKRLNIFFLAISIFISYNTFVLVNSFVKIWLGNEITLEKRTIILISFNIQIRIFRKVLDAYKDSYGYFSDIQSPILESLINLVFSIILGLKLGLDGIILGTLISNILIIIIYKPLLVFKNCFNKEKKEYFITYSNYLILSIFCVFILKQVDKLDLKLNVNNWIEWIKYASFSSFISSIIIIGVFLLNKDFRMILKSILKNK